MEAKAATLSEEAKLKAATMEGYAAMMERDARIKAKIKEWEGRLQTSTATAFEAGATTEASSVLKKLSPALRHLTRFCSKWQQSKRRPLQQQSNV